MKKLRKKNLFTHSLILKLVSWMLIVSIINLTYSCRFYYRVNAPANPSINTINDLRSANKFIVLHFEDELWQLNSVEISGNSINSVKSGLKGPTKYFETDPRVPNRYLKNAKIDESWVLNEVHIHVKEYADLGNGKISFPFESIKSIQLYDADEAATVGSWFFGAIGFVGGAIGLLAIIVALTKESCQIGRASCRERV